MESKFLQIREEQARQLDVLVVGGGGREHALAWKIAQSPLCARIFVAPGNGGTPEWNVNLDTADDAAVLDFVKREHIDLVVIGPEEPLTRGLADALRATGVRVFGPGREAARLEGSKAFAREITTAAGIPSPVCRVFSDKEEALAYVQKTGAPIVIKADGLAAGKGVVVAHTTEEAAQAVEDILGGAFGAAGNQIVIEECLTGQEISLLCLCDGQHALPLMAVQDHKRAEDGDRGPNTGGMGTYAPPPFWNKQLEKTVIKRVAEPVLAEMRRRGTPFSGMLFIGLMLTVSGVKVLEFNVRFGDPETQVLMLMLKSDILPLLVGCAEGRLPSGALSWETGAAVCVVLAAPGYPAAYKKGIPLALPDLPPDTMIFHAGTTLNDGQLLSSGGRVLGVTAQGRNHAQAQARAYALAAKVGFPAAHYRRDIAQRALRFAALLNRCRLILRTFTKYERLYFAERIKM
jgi:phosphoribosylamine--glycine ligase